MSFSALDLSSLTIEISDRQLENLCRDNPEIRLETDAQGKLIQMSPTGGETGKRNSDLLIQLGIWNRQTTLGEVFDSSTGFRLANGAVRSPDVSWIPKSKWTALTKEQRRKFLPLDPDFVIELMSPTDELRDLQQKMLEYLECGVKLAWLIDPDRRQVEIYRQDAAKEILTNPVTLSGEGILPGLVVELSEIWD